MTARFAAWSILGAALLAGCHEELLPARLSDCETISLQTTAQDAYDDFLGCVYTAPGDEARDLAMQALVAKVEENGGFPIVHEGSVSFVYVAAPQWDPLDDQRTSESFDPTRRYPPLRVMGAFNDWDPDSGPTMLEAPQGVFHLTVPLSEVPGRGYRFVGRDRADNSIRFSDPLSRRFDYDPDGRRSLIEGDLEQGHIEWVHGLPAVALGRPRPLYVWVPPGYEQSSDRYPVLYMHDGNNLFDRNQVGSSPGGTWDADTIMQQELSAGRVRPAIIVGIPNSEARIDEYTHVVDERDNRPTGGQGDAYLDFLIDEVKPAVDARFRTRPERESTGIMGSSLGGLISFYAGYRNPEIFRFVGGMSSTFIWGRIGKDGPTVIDLYEQLEDLVQRDQVFYLDSGGGPDPFCPGGADNYCETVQMRDLLLQKGIDRQPADPNASPLEPDLNLFWYWSEGAQHNEPNWRIRLHRALRLFLQ